ncbi:MAG: nitroimidazol reductase NimA-like FMN-containing flavoprotein [Candidatus Poriferisodalaceae bacterium]|jgi:nitroimidazol reductase NimA-like FMN-containing flavoprotein (pyridoxamine 5'-phosphate oxidase superfamily)
MTDRTFSDPAIQRYISGKEVVVLAMLTSRGGPLATPMWFVNDGEQLAMVSVDGLAKIRNLERDSRVSVVAEGGEGGESGAIGVVLAGEVRFLDGDERHKWGRRFREKYSPNIERLWGGQAIPDNRRVFAFAPRVASAFGL